MSALDRYEPVIGLEVHVHLKTESKMFCACAVRYGSGPNHETCPVCLALPGSLPVLNARAVELAVRAALALEGELQPRSIFARKNYFYPDLPKGYQISQYEEPVMLRGALEIELPGADGAAPRRIAITRLHMEEDAGKSVHDQSEGKDESHMDMNRAGVPLLEIVSEPELRSAAEASAYLRALRQLLRYVGASDADMERGQMRCDVNLSLRPRGESALGTRTETKNLNSFRFVEGAIEAEIERQAELLDAGGSVVQATLLYDADAGRTRVMRIKENADDYRYFPDPDLVPLELLPDWLAEQRAALPELPARRRARFEFEHGLSAYQARLLTESRPLADFYEAAVAAHGSAKTVASWTLRDVLALLKESGRELEQTALEPAALAALLRRVDARSVTAQNARELLRELAERGGDVEALVRERGVEAVSDAESLAPAVDEVLAAHPEMVEKLRAGEGKVLNYLMGQVMKRTGGKADPAAVRALISRRLGL